MNNTTFSPLVSIIIPSFGRPQYLSKALDSLLSQSYKNLEIIIIDDNKNDEDHLKTLNVFNEYSSDSRIIYYHDGINRGGGLARNKGIEIAKGKYISFLDDDDTYCKDKIFKQLKHIQSNNLDVSVCDMFFCKNGKLLDISNCYARVDSPAKFLLNGNAYTPMIMATKHILNGVGGFTDTPRYQDHVLMLKLFINKAKIGHLNQKLFIHNNHSGPRITNTSKFEIAHNIRNTYEMKIYPNLSIDEQYQFQVNTLLIKAKIFRFNNDNLSAYKAILKALKYSRNGKDVIRTLKALIRITFFKNRPI